jgi:hypothetical protein
LSAAEGSAAVGSVETFLTRIGRLRDGSAEDQQAVLLLIERKILGPELESQLHAWLKTAKQGAGPSPIAAESDASRSAANQAEAKFFDNAAAFHQWLGDWRGQAREVITRGDYRIRLGLSQRRSEASSPTDEADSPDDGA